MHYLGQKILCGEYQPGDTLYTEAMFADSFDVSRSAYREAIRGLAAKGLVESRTKAGTTVLPKNRWNLLDTDVLAWAFAGKPDMRLIRSLFELRGLIEPAAARFAADRRDKDDLRRLKDALADMRRYTLGTEAGRIADRNFHDALLRASRNDALIVLSAGIGAAINWTTELKQRSHSSLRNPIQDHAKVYEAIAARDGDAAAQAMAALVELALEDTRLSLE